MTLIPHSCVTIECDKCGLEVENGDGVTLHFDAKYPDLDFYGDDWVEWKGPDDVWHHWHDDCAPACTCSHQRHEHDGGSDGCDGETDDTGDDETGACSCESYTPLIPLPEAQP